VVILLVIVSALIGYNMPKPVEGYWASNSTGEWVCVNIKGMSFERALEVCKHEVGHEIFAEACEKDMEKCMAVDD